MSKLPLFFTDLPEPRASNTRHKLGDVLFIALASVLCGGEGCSDMAAFGRAKEPLLRQFIDLSHGVPSHDTFSRLFRLLDPDAFAFAFARFMAAFAEAVEHSGKAADKAAGGVAGVIAIDGKALRRAYQRGQAHMPPAMVSAWGVESRLALASVASPGGNEVAGALAILELLDLTGAIVTADALHCHRAMAEAIQSRGGDYALALKGNQSGLLRDAHACLKKANKQTPHPPMAETMATSHGRKEHRQAIVINAGAMARKHGFPGLTAIARITCQRDDAPPAERLYLLSQHLTPETALAVTRAHWDIENGLHWNLDVTLGEDGLRMRKDNAPANIALLNRLALNLTNAIEDPKTSTRQKFKRAAWDEQYLIKIISQMR